MIINSRSNSSTNTEKVAKTDIVSFKISSSKDIIDKLLLNESVNNHYLNSGWIQKRKFYWRLLRSSKFMKKVIS